MDIELRIQVDAFASATTTIQGGGPPDMLRFDSNGYVTVGFGSAFAATNGSYN